jgi:hypothetical protein
MGIQNRDSRQDFSRLRQSLLELTEEIMPLIRTMLSDKPVIKGTVYELKRKCGKPGCRCTKGQLHSRMVLSESLGGKTKLQVIPKGSLAEVKIKARRYQQFRQARARLGEIHKKMLGVIDQVEIMRREEMIIEGKQTTGATKGRKATPKTPPP